MILGLKAKLIAGAIAVSAAFGAGWVVKGKFEDSRDLAALEAQNKLAREIREGMNEVATNVEHTLARQDRAERIIDRGIIKEVQKPVYVRVCLPDASIRLLNNLAAGASTEQLDGEVSGDAAAAD